MKTCSRCKQEKDESDFSPDTRKEGKLLAACRDCIRLRQKAYNDANRDSHKEWCKSYYQNNKQACKDRAKKWEEKNKDSVVSRKREYQKKKYNTSIHYRLRVILRARLNCILGGKQKAGSAVRDLGCSTEELKKHIESQWEDGMSWDNYGRGKDKWSIDHIIPISLFNLEDEEQLKKACHYTNLKPMWFSDNASKGNRHHEHL